jgi:hypothetical protein
MVTNEQTVNVDQIFTRGMPKKPMEFLGLLPTKKMTQVVGYLTRLQYGCSALVLSSTEQGNCSPGMRLVSVRERRQACHKVHAYGTMR